MPNVERLVPVNAAMHIMCRGNNKQNIFHGDRDKFEYYSSLVNYKEENQVSIFHYCIMNNHVHLVVRLAEKTTVSRFIKQVNLSYYNYYKKIYDYAGHLWQARFKSRIIDTDVYLLQCGKYIELNPVRGGLVKSPKEYLFSSYNHYACEKYDPIITDSPMYLGLSDSKKKRTEEYINYIVPSGELFSPAERFPPGEPFSVL
ncbi:MAG: transposase [Deltaproteobacteria bacterium]